MRGEETLSKDLGWEADNEKNKKRFEKVMNERMDGLEKESQKKRVRKVLKAVEKLG